jgi:hypothetical protein
MRGAKENVSRDSLVGECEMRLVIRTGEGGALEEDEGGSRGVISK